LEHTRDDDDDEEEAEEEEEEENREKMIRMKNDANDFDDWRQ
jgi:hypothetical protein